MTSRLTKPISNTSDLSILFLSFPLQYKTKVAVLTAQLAAAREEVRAEKAKAMSYLRASKEKERRVNGENAALVQKCEKLKAERKATLVRIGARLAVGS